MKKITLDLIWRIFPYSKEITIFYKRGEIDKIKIPNREGGAVLYSKYLDLDTFPKSKKETLTIKKPEVNNVK